jgi:nucleotide-binding universal stress UspA family protein
MTRQQLKFLMRFKGIMVPFLANEGEQNRLLEKVLVPTDFSAESRIAIRKAADVARRFGGIVLLLHVVDLTAQAPSIVPLNDAEVRAELYLAAQEQLDRQVAELGAEAINARPLIREGMPAEEILDAAEGCDLIVIGKPKPKSHLNLFARHTVETVIEAAPCSVLTVN